MPVINPRIIVNTPEIIDSFNNILKICLFSMPRILYKPSSFYRRLIKKLLVYKRKIIENIPTTTVPNPRIDVKEPDPGICTNPSLFAIIIMT